MFYCKPGDCNVIRYTLKFPESGGGGAFTKASTVVFITQWHCSGHLTICLKESEQVLDDDQIERALIAEFDDVMADAAGAQSDDDDDLSDEAADYKTLPDKLQYLQEYIHNWFTPIFITADLCLLYT